MKPLNWLTEKIEFGTFDNKEKLGEALQTLIPCSLNNIIFFCIGTDRATGDCYGPLVGTYLKEKGYPNVMGCIDEPIHAVNLKEKIKEIPKEKTVIAIDACLGKYKNVGSVLFQGGCLAPGAGVKKELETVGDYSIKGVVNVGGYIEQLVIQNTRLSTVIKLAKLTSDAIEQAFPIHNRMNQRTSNSIK